MKPFFSIIVPCCDVEPYLRDCLNSVLKQPFTDWECILGVETSKDKTEEVVREYVGRDILAAWGKLDREMFVIYVCHFLSRRTGVNSSAGFRRAGAETVRAHALAMQARYPGIKVIIMGDMNDSPRDESLSLLLKARRNIHSVVEGEFFNPFWQLLEEGKGTSIYGNRWVLYDNIIVSHNLIKGAVEGKRGLHIVRCDEKHYGEIFRRPFMIHKGHPKRSFNGNQFQNGYSDHLPVLIRLNR